MTSSSQGSTRKALSNYKILKCIYRDSRAHDGLWTARLGAAGQIITRSAAQKEMEEIKKKKSIEDAIDLVPNSIIRRGQ